MDKQPVSFFWFRRDLRLQDNAGLYHALKSGLPVIPLFIFDKNILDQLENKSDPRVTFIHQSIIHLKHQLNELGSDLVVLYDTPDNAWKTLFEEYTIKNIFTNRDYEPYAKQRDSVLSQMAAAKGCTWNDYKDQCIFERDEVIKDDGTPYTIFTPYSKKWKAKLDAFYLKTFPTEKHFSSLNRTNATSVLPSLAQMGFKESNTVFPSVEVPQSVIKNYTLNRDFPSIQGTSHLGIHFRFGTISIREKANKARQLNETFLNELIWRDFYMMILDHFPQIGEGKAFKPQYDFIRWRNEEKEFALWCEGKTGYPIVDAGMRELNATGFMHNRVRMIVASFLTKHLLIDWRWGEAYFAEKLLDYDLSANNGGWQWAAGCGTDAAPYFRLFNPTLQAQKFDPQQQYINQWVPELNTPEYPKPMVEHAFARNRCLEIYKAALMTKHR